MDEPQNPSPRPTEPPPADPPPSSPPPFAPPPPTPVYQAAAPPAQKSKLPWILGGCGCLTLLALLVGAGVYAFYQYRAERLRKTVQDSLSAPSTSPAATPHSATGLGSSSTPKQVFPVSPTPPATGIYGKRLEYNGGSLYYTSKVTEAEARKLGEFLLKGEFFDGRAKDTQLNKTGATYEFRMVPKKGLENDQATIETFKQVAREISSNVFADSPVEVHLCDEKMETIRVVKPDASTHKSSAIKTYVSARDKVPAALAERFVAFSFDYPSTFTVQPQEDEIFVTLQKTGGTDGEKVTQTFTVGWYEPPDPESRREVNRVLTEQTRKWSDFLPAYRCREVRKFSETVSGVDGRAVLVQFVTRDGKSTFVAAGKTIVVRPTGEDHGVAISLYGTWEDPAIKSAADLGVNDDLAKILRSFKFL